MGKKKHSSKVSMNDIAKKLKISKNTVSLAFRGVPCINENTRDLILKTAKELGYVYKKNLSAKTNINPASRNICLIMSSSEKNRVSFFSYIQYGVEAEAKKNNINTILYYLDECEANNEIPLCIKDGIVSGILTLGNFNKNHIYNILDYGLPTVIIDQYFDDIPANYVITDNISSAYIATKFLIECGHRNIGFCGNIHRASSFYDRFVGFTKAMKHFNIPQNAYEKYCILDSDFQKLVYKDLSQGVNQIKSLPELPTAFLCCNDTEAVALYKIFEEIKINIPKDISIMGFDNDSFATRVSPELTTMNVKKEYTGARAVQLLIDIMNGANNCYQKILILANLIERQSVVNIINKSSEQFPLKNSLC